MNGFTQRGNAISRHTHDANNASLQRNTTDATTQQFATSQLHVLRLANGTPVVNEVGHYDLGEGIPAAAVSLGDVIYVPGGGIDLHDLDGDCTRDKTHSLPSQARTMFRIHWREPGIDPL